MTQADFFQPQQEFGYETNYYYPRASQSPRKWPHIEVLQIYPCEFSKWEGEGCYETIAYKPVKN